MFNTTKTERMEMCNGGGRFTAELNGDTVLLHSQDLALPATATRAEFNAAIQAGVYGPI